MAEFEISTLVRFIAQLGIIVVGAASLWGFVFARRAHRSTERTHKQGCFGILNVLLRLNTSALVVFLVGWWTSVLVFFPKAIFAHEGVAHSVDVATEFIRNGFSFNLPWVSALTVIGLGGAVLAVFKKDLFHRTSEWYFGIIFVFASVILLFTAYTGSFGREQFTQFFHNWHSVITLGTVIVVDALYIFTAHKEKLQSVLYNFYPRMSAVIWFGLGLEFIASYLAFDGSFSLTSQFLFNQFVVGIIIINGALLSERINGALIRGVHSDRVEGFSGKMEKIVSISGSVSIASWLTITILDFFVIPYSFTVLLIGYFVFIGIMYAGESTSKHILARFAPESVKMHHLLHNRS